MLKIIILLSAFSAFFLSYDYLTQTISLSSHLSLAQAQESSLENNIDLTGIWEENDGVQVKITQTGSEVIATYYPSPTAYCQEEEAVSKSSEHDFVFKGTADGNEVMGKESTWCYYGFSNPDENGLFINPFKATISDNGNKLTLFSTNRFTGEADSRGFSKISGLEGVEGSQTNVQESSTTDQPSNAFNMTSSLPESTTDQPSNAFNMTSSLPESTTDQPSNAFNPTLPQIKNPLSTLQHNDLPQLLLLAGLAVAAIGGTAAFAKHKSSKKSQRPEGNVAVITRGGIE